MKKSGEKEMKIEQTDMKIFFDEKTLKFTIEKSDTVWRWKEDYVPHLVCQEGKISFLDAKNILHKEYRTDTKDSVWKDRRFRIVLKRLSG